MPVLVSERLTVFSISYACAHSSKVISCESAIGMPEELARDHREKQVHVQTRGGPPAGILSALLGSLTTKGDTRTLYCLKDQ